MCATKAEYACNYMYMYFGLNVNNRIINSVLCVNSCKLDKYDYIFHTDWTYIHVQAIWIMHIGI